jgi:hypothetical protein
MTDDGVIAIIERIKAAWPQWRPGNVEELAGAYRRAFSDLADSEVTWAVDELAKTTSRVPTINVIRDTVLIERRKMSGGGQRSCRWCAGSGWVILEGTRRVDGLTTSRGSAPCRWCEDGKKAYRAASRRGDDPETNFSESDVLASDVADDDVFHPDAAFLLEEEQRGIPREVLQMMFPRAIWPGGWDRTHAPALKVLP